MSQPVKVYGSDAEKRELRHRAQLHGMSLSAYMLRAALGDSNAPADDPDGWWASLTPSRKESVRRWLTEGRGGATEQVKGQTPLFETGDTA